MKAYLLTNDNGHSYDDYSWWVKAVLMVPDDFDPDKDRVAHYEGLKTSNPHWFRKDGQISDRYVNSAFLLWESNLRSRFESIPFIGGEG